MDERNSALYNATCVHASFGDVELAQISLRGDLPWRLVFFLRGQDTYLPPGNPVHIPCLLVSLFDTEL